MTGGKNVSPIPASREDPAVSAEKALTAGAAGRAAELPAAGIKTVAGTEPALNAGTFSELKGSGALVDLHTGTMAHTEKIIFINHHLQSPGGYMFDDDHRISKRFNHEAPVVIEKFGCRRYANGRMFNYSRGGIYFESDVAFQPGTRIRIDIDKSQNGLAANRYYAVVKWCKEISAAVVLYDYGIGVEFDPAKNRTAGTGRLKVIDGRADRKKS